MPMTIPRDLTVAQLRVIGALLEKELTTPDQYPLSLNALTAACNQKTNRDPVLELAESDVQAVIDELRQQRLIMEESGFGSRVPKYRHRFCNTEFGALKLSPQELGIVCVLLLRGAQTPGELRTRTQRLCDFADVGQVEHCLDAMAARDEPLVRKLPREPGQRESRYMHLFGCDDDAVAQSAPAASGTAHAVAHTQAAAGLTIAALVARIDVLEQEIIAVKKRLDDAGA
jgi:uncharacterized protein YceH (UPF0502 family)